VAEEYLRVKNWEKFQHYKKRNPPWIKLHRSLMTDSDFLSMPEVAQYELIRIWLVASSGQDMASSRQVCGQGVVSSRQDCVKRIAGLRRLRYWNLLIQKGFLIPDASITLAPCKQNATTETETETETEKKEQKKRTGSAQKAALRPSGGTPEKSGTTPEAEALAFAGSHFKITKGQDRMLQEAFPWADLQGEYRKMDSWLEANPTRRPKRISAFAHNWMNRERPNAANKNGTRPSGAIPAAAGKYDNIPKTVADV